LNDPAVQPHEARWRTGRCRRHPKFILNQAVDLIQQALAAIFIDVNSTQALAFVSGSGILGRSALANQEFIVGQKVLLSEKSMQVMEERIPELASHAFRLAYFQALTTGTGVLEAVDGTLVETSADGDRKVLRKLRSPTKVEPGSRRMRARQP
jgi:hypothetical protein